jgi:hypothetical protein
MEFDDWSLPNNGDEIIKELSEVFQSNKELHILDGSLIAKPWNFITDNKIKPTL